MSLVSFLEANAGTGKTTHLMNAILNVIDSGLPLNRICAVTFTEKAANEMVDRLRSKIAERISMRIFRPAVLDQMNQCFIGTIHAFCAQVLRRYGERIGIPPAFEIDEGPIFETLFQSRWDQFISKILKLRAGPYRVLVQELGITTLEEIALLLVSRRHEFTRPDEVSLDWFLSEIKDVQRWDFNPGSGWYEAALKAVKDFERHRSLLAVLCDAGQIKGEWRDAIRDALRCKNEGLHNAIEALQQDFTRQLVHEYRSLGYLRFDDLLIDTRDLLRNHFDVRARLKKRYDRILLDEMQDTDPLQYEIFFYLCERNDREDFFRLQDVISRKKPLRLEESKLFVVGDPKQSIYGFRNADVGAYQIVRDILEREGVIVSPLVDNQRSCRNIVAFTNAMAKRFFAAQRPADSQSQRDYCDGTRIQDCIHLIRIRSQEASAQHLRVLTEATWLADKVRELVKSGSYSYEDIGILLRKLTNAHFYVDAFCARKIPIVIEGERFLYQTQEVIDLINLLKCIVDEMDSIALAGMLRSPLFGLNDPELAIFFQSYLQDCNVATALEHALEGVDQDRIQTLQSFLMHISQIRAKIRELTPARLMDEVLTRFPLLPIGGIAYGPHRGEMAPLNILKIHKEALEADLDPSITADRFVRLQESYSKEAKQREQETMADEGGKAVRVLSIHKSKGLDFPVVFVPLTDYGTGGLTATTEVLQNWHTDIIGLKANDFTDTNYLRLRYADNPRESTTDDPLLAYIDDEERRVLYVASTRAKKQIYFSFVELATARKDKNPGKRIFELLAELHPAVREGIESSTPSCTVSFVEQTTESTRLGSVLDEWKRIDSAQSERTLPLLTTITEEASEEDLLWGPKVERVEDSFELIVGLICHGTLERIDFHRPDNFDLLVEIEACKLLGRFAAKQVNQAKTESVGILRTFLDSDVVSWLASVEILGREVPVTLFDPGENKICTGKIDVVVREENNITIIDYKTISNLEESMKAIYRKQMSLYARALDPLLLRPATLKLCLLRSGEFITLR